MLDSRAKLDKVVKLLASGNASQALRVCREVIAGEANNLVLMDAPRFARHLESLYRQSWHAYCDGVMLGSGRRRIAGAESR